MGVRPRARLAVVPAHPARPRDATRAERGRRFVHHCGPTRNGSLRADSGGVVPVLVKSSCKLGFELRHPTRRDPQYEGDFFVRAIPSRHRHQSENFAGLLAYFLTPKNGPIVEVDANLLQRTLIHAFVSQRLSHRHAWIVLVGRFDGHHVDSPFDTRRFGGNVGRGVPRDTPALSVVLRGVHDGLVRIDPRQDTAAGGALACLKNVRHDLGDGVFSIVGLSLAKHALERLVISSRLDMNQSLAGDVESEVLGNCMGGLQDGRGRVGRPRSLWRPGKRLRPRPTRVWPLITR